MLVFNVIETHRTSLFCRNVKGVHNVSLVHIPIHESKEMKQKINREHFSFCEVSSHKGNQKVPISFYRRYLSYSFPNLFY